MAIRSVFDHIKSLTLGFLLISAAAAVLLYSDLGSRNRDDNAARDAQRQLRVAIVQHASLDPIDIGVEGILSALESRGYVDGERISVRRYIAENDMATANSIAKDVTSGDYDLIITASTVSLQTVANANRFATPPRRHVFGISSDPYGAGVGINRDNHFEHPPYMTGLGSLPPVREAFEMLRPLRPDVARVGMVWNPAEANSVAANTLARAVCAELGIELVEANADTSTIAGEAAASVLSRGVDALWISPDVTIATAADVLIAAARRAQVPTFTSLPGHADRGALFDMGADYRAIGFTEGLLAADVLDGQDPATIPVENLMPVELHINLLALEGLGPQWQVPDDVREEAQVLISTDGRREKERPAQMSVALRKQGGPLTRKMTVDLIEYADTPNTDVSRLGVMDGLAQAGLVLDRDFELRRHTAQGDIATLSSIIDNVLTRRTDLMITLSTPTLQNALQRGRQTPVVFSMVSNPFIVNAGTTDSDHLPFVTGAYLDQPLAELLDAIKKVFPNAKRIGTLYSPAEINSEFNMQELETLAHAAGYEFIKIGVATTGDVADAAIALASMDLDVWTQIADNLIASSFPAVMEASRRARVPVITFSPSAADFGALMIVARDYYDTGVESGLLAARVLRGEPIADIPFATSSTLDYIVNLKTAADYRIQIPQELIDKANRVIPEDSP
jgi:ABC-type uncharacterized transport system substrate-binding protein